MLSSVIGSTYNWPWLYHVLSMSSTGGKVHCSLLLQEGKRIFFIAFTFLFILNVNAPIFINKRVGTYSCYKSSICTYTFS